MKQDQDPEMGTWSFLIETIQMESGRLRKRNWTMLPFSQT